MTDQIFSDVMVDIETMSLHQTNALILSIGLAEFDPRPDAGLALGQTALILPSITEQLLLGRRVDPDTQKFWADPNQKEASKHWIEGVPLPLEVAMKKLQYLLKDAERIWANGIMFDLCNLADLYQQVTGERLPWHYQAPRDMRTLCRDFPQTRTMELGAALDLIEQVGVIDHHPVSDCLTQAYKVWQHWPVASADV